MSTIKARGANGTLRVQHSPDPALHNYTFGVVTLNDGCAYTVDTDSFDTRPLALAVPDSHNCADHSRPRCQRFGSSVDGWQGTLHFCMALVQA